MLNPWLEIPYQDYEGHMLEVGQSQILNALVKSSLSKYLPGSFALLGCASGNGLEHVSTSTREAYAIDINPAYLAVVRERFQDNANIKTIRADIQQDKLAMKDIDLFFIGLVLEYVDPVKALSNVLDTISNNGILVLVLQKSNPGCFVSGTGFKSLEKLKSISNEVKEEDICTFLINKNFTGSERREIPISADKSFIVLEFKHNSNYTDNYGGCPDDCVRKRP